MSAERFARTVLCGLALCGGLALAAEDDALESDFLEYLGMWEESDEDWLMLDKTKISDEQEKSEAENEGEESPEKDDES